MYYCHFKEVGSPPHRVKLAPIALLWPLLTPSEQLRQSLDELPVAIALLWPMLTPTRRVGVNTAGAFLWPLLTPTNWWQYRHSHAI